MKIVRDSNEEMYLQLRKLGERLKIPTFEAFLELEVKDERGAVVHHHRQRSHSWVRNAYNLMFCQLAGKDANDAAVFGAGKLNLKDTGGTVRNDNTPLAFGGYAINTSTRYSADGVGGNTCAYRAAAGDDTQGIIAGSGVNAETFEDYALQTKIANGTGAGQLSYVQSEAHAVAYDAGTKVLRNTLIRYFNNNSGGNISVNEIGIVGLMPQIVNMAPKILISRDKLAATLTVPNTGQLKVTYSVQLTYPA